MTRGLWIPTFGLLTVVAFGGTVEQVTSEVADVSRRDVAIDQNGNTYALSNIDPLGTNPQRALQIFRFSPTGVPEQLTTLTRGAGPGLIGRTLGVDDAGTRVAFVSDGDPLGSNADGNRELFLLEPGVGLTQLTDEPGTSGTIAAIVACPSRVVFTADYDYLGSNGDRLLQIFTVESDGSNLTQVTSLTEDVWSIDADATCQRIIFATPAPFLGTTFDGEPKVFGIENDSTGARLFVEGSVNGVLGVTISGDGSAVTYGAGADLVWRPWNLAAGSILASEPGGFVGVPDLDFSGQTAVYYRGSSFEPWWTPSVAGGVPFQLFAAPACDYQRLSRTGTAIAMSCGSGSLAALPFDLDPVDDHSIYYVDPAALSGVKLVDNDPHLFDADLVGNDGGVIFVSNRDPLGLDADGGGEVYRRSPDGAVEKLTTITGSVTRVKASSNGYFVYLSDGNPLGGNADGSFELFLGRVGSPLPTQVTFSLAGTNVGDFEISRFGAVVTFVADDNPFGGNPDNSPELFVYDRLTAVRTQLTSHSEPFAQINNPATSDAGDRIVFASTVDFEGLGGDEGYRVFVYRSDTASVEQLSDSYNGPGIQRNSGQPDISADGTRVVFTSSVPEGYPAIYLDTGSGAVRISPEADSANAKISADGAFVAFDTRGCLFDSNGSEDIVSVRYDVAGGSYERAVGLRYGDGTFRLGDGRSVRSGAIDDDGRRILLVNSNDPTGQNPGQIRQAFLVDFDAPSTIEVVNNGAATMLSWAPEPQARRYDVVRGTLDAIAVVGDSVDLGPVVCVADDTAGNVVTDTELPGSGEVFFYVRRGSAGDLSGAGDYGSDDMGRPRTVASGDCTQAVSPTCAHDPCVEGAALSAGGCPDACVAEVCAVDSFCCATEWDALCVSRVLSVCDSMQCDATFTCNHSLCEVGAALVVGCDPSCVEALCNVDSFCCNNQWDATCVDEVATICGLSCEPAGLACGQ